MSQYFDKNFFKLFIGFVAILGVSYMLIVLARIYESEHTQSGSGSTQTSEK